MRLSRLALIPLFGHPPLSAARATLKQVWGDPDQGWLAGGGFTTPPH